MSSAIGRKKKSIAKAFLIHGNGNIQINNQPVEIYMQNNPYCLNLIQKPLQQLGLLDQYNILLNVSGGGLQSQAYASVLAISRALEHINPKFRGMLKSQGFLTQDSRRTERKKYGLKKARKAPQYSKR